MKVASAQKRVAPGGVIEVLAPWLRRPSSVQFKRVVDRWPDPIRS
jgi:hypothetical protein